MSEQMDGVNERRKVWMNDELKKEKKNEQASEWKN
jgi:hypothetical protein